MHIHLDTLKTWAATEFAALEADAAPHVAKFVAWVEGKVVTLSEAERVLVAAGYTVTPPAAAQA